ncbi:hypothetical protein OC683_02360 ['Crotalaria aegyptiaca' phytoplasma]|uniref:Uncharacterized protein n=1 Tax=Candidatus Phytoplasma crotalariae TaxID=2982627 RepID=A0ABT9D681_9MOLU|nr:hypothetical protein ['Crotalaria aegyptiaca' phytoplasma]MDO8059433.1 hypothetical protein ['Crotalaria aegyptiaca' phytoplasma]
MKAERCENCDKTTQLQIHHMGTIRKANRQRIRQVLCKDYHQKITRY